MPRDEDAQIQAGTADIEQQAQMRIASLRRRPALSGASAERQKDARVVAYLQRQLEERENNRAGEDSRALQGQGRASRHRRKPAIPRAFAHTQDDACILPDNAPAQRRRYEHENIHISQCGRQPQGQRQASGHRRRPAMPRAIAQGREDANIIPDGTWAQRQRDEDENTHTSSIGAGPGPERPAHRHRRPSGIPAQAAMGSSRPSGASAHPGHATSSSALDGEIYLQSQIPIRLSRRQNVIATPAPTSGLTSPLAMPPNRPTTPENRIWRPPLHLAARPSATKRMRDCAKTVDGQMATAQAGTIALQLAMRGIAQGPPSPPVSQGGTGNIDPAATSGGDDSRSVPDKPKTRNPFRSFGQWFQKASRRSSAGL
ncbi:hypothetical protein LTR36_007168 [Oleoguttula mirabilis]|uniref:Uncharacterized protein n=1 Tax=Oleoguttula mirabilis TaxID=1507867 RepID=A0AAV9JC31_9PEZI|nr:hypothetical protein LTR36_007168 [Oleoguttula mirabilis]